MAGKYEKRYKAYLKSKKKNEEKTTSDKLDATNKTVANYKARLDASGIDPEKATDKRNWFEKLTNLPEDQNFLFDFFDLINRPQQAIFGGVKEYQEGGNFSEGVKKGFTGQDTTQFKEILQNGGMKDSGKKLGWDDVLGFAGDVVLDPMNIPLVPVAGKLSSLDDLVGKGVKNVVKSGVGLVDNTVEKTLGKLDELKGVDGVKLGYANIDAKDASNLQKFVKNKADLVDDVIPTGRLEKYKQAKNELTNMFKVSDKSKKAIWTGRKLDISAKEAKASLMKLGKGLYDKVDAYAKATGKDFDDVAKKVVLLLEDGMDRTIERKKLLDMARGKNLVYTDEIKQAFDDLLVSIPDDLKSKMDFSITKTGKGTIKLGDGWTKEVMEGNGIELNPDLLKEKVNYGKFYSKESLDEIDELKELYKNDEGFRKLYDETSQVFNKGNKVIDKSLGTKLGKKYDNNLGYAPQTAVNKGKFAGDLDEINPKLTKGNTSVLSDRTGLGSMRERNELYRNSILNKKNVSAEQKAFLEKNPDLFEENIFKAFSNRYFDELPDVAKNQKILNDVLLGQTFGDADEIKALQKQIHKASKEGDEKLLKELSTKYNELTETTNIKFLTDYDSKVPTGYVKIEKNEAKQLLAKIDTLGKQFGETNDIKKLRKAIEGAEGKIAINSDVLRMLSVYSDTKNLKGMRRMYDTWLNHFKKWKTASPTFLMNNFTGNSTNLALSGIGMTDQARLGTKAYQIVAQGKDLYARKLAGEVLDDASNELADFWEMFYKTGFGGDEIALNMQDMPDSLKKYFSGDNTPKTLKEIMVDGIPYLNNKANITMDNMSRVVIMLKSLEDPSYMKNLGVNNIQEAISKVMFDPSMLTDFERNTMKKIVPFYTYAKNNIVYHIDNMGNNMGRYERLIQSVQNLQKEATNGNDKDMAEYIKNSLYIPIPGLKEDGSYTVLRSQLPFGQLTDLVNDPLQSLTSLITPLVKAPIELSTNTNSFTGNPISEFKGQKSKNIPFLTKQQEHILSAFSGLDVPLKTANRMYQGFTDGGNIGESIMNTLTMNNNVDTDKLYRNYDKISELQDIMKKYEQEGYEVSTINELKQANKNSTISNINAILAKYGVK